MSMMKRIIFTTAAALCINTSAQAGVVVTDAPNPNDVYNTCKRATNRYMDKAVGIAQSMGTPVPNSDLNAYRKDAETGCREHPVTMIEAAREAGLYLDRAIQEGKYTRYKRPGVDETLKRPIGGAKYEF